MSKKIKSISTQLQEQFKIEVEQNENIISFQKKNKIFEATVNDNEIYILSNYNPKYLSSKLSFLNEFYTITHNSVIYLETDNKTSINNGDSYYRSACSDALYIANGNFQLRHIKRTDCMGTIRYEYKVI